MNQPYVYIYSLLFEFPSPSDQPRALSSLCYTVASHWLPVLCIVSIMCTCQSQSPNSSPSPFPLSIHLFVLCFCVSISALQISHLCHFSRLHIYPLIYDIRFSLYDLLHSVWYSLSLSMSLQMTQYLSLFMD